jgi:hypothetical protein
MTLQTIPGLFIDLDVLVAILASIPYKPVRGLLKHYRRASTLLNRLCEVNQHKGK